MSSTTTTSLPTPSATSTQGCDGIFGTCTNTVEMVFILLAIIVACVIIFTLPFLHCRYQNRKALEKKRQEGIERIELQLRAQQFATAADMARDDAAGDVDDEGRPWQQVWVRDFGAEVDAILPAPPLQPAMPIPAKNNLNRRSPVDLEAGADVGESAQSPGGVGRAY